MSCFWRDGGARYERLVDGEWMQHEDLDLFFESLTFLNWNLWNLI